MHVQLYKDSHIHIQLNIYLTISYDVSGNMCATKHTLTVKYSPTLYILHNKPNFTLLSLEVYSFSIDGSTLSMIVF